MLNKAFVVIGGGYHQLPLIREIKKQGLKLIIVDKNVSAPGFEYADYSIVYDSYDYKGILKRVMVLAKKVNIVGVATQASRGAIITTSYLASKLETKWLNFKTAFFITDKKFISKKFNGDIHINNYQKELNFPIVLKDPDLSGSMGVLKIESKKEFDKFIKTKNLKNFNKFILEKFIEGKHLIVLGLKTNEFLKLYGIAEKFIDNKMRTKLVIFPSSLDREDSKLVVKYSEQLLREINFDFGPFMIELILENGTKKLYVAEIEASLTGSHFMEIMIPTVTDAIPIKETINTIIGKKIKKSVKKFDLFYAQKYYYPNKFGKIKKIFIEGCEGDIKLFPHIREDIKNYTPKLYFFNAVLVGRYLRKKEILEKLERCNLNIIQ